MHRSCPAEAAEVSTHPPALPALPALPEEEPKEEETTDYHPNARESETTAATTEDAEVFVSEDPGTRTGQARARLLWSGHGNQRKRLYELRLALMDPALSSLKALSDPTRDPTREEGVSTGNYDIDRLLGGGLPRGMVVQFAGSSGTGKTQLCLQLCADVAARRVCSRDTTAAYYVHTRGQFPIERFRELLHERWPLLKASPPQTAAALSCLFVEHTRDFRALVHILMEKVPALLLRQNVSALVLVLDALPDCFPQEDNQSYLARASQLFALGYLLRKIAQTLNTTVVVCNHMRALQHSNAVTGARCLVPALGRVWDTMPDVRVQLHRKTRPLDACTHKDQLSHSFKLHSSPHMPPDEVAFGISSLGIVT